MGMRQNIELKYSDDAKVYLYSHWDGDDGNSPLKQKLRRAIARKERWDDESYLSRIIFSEVIGGDIDGEAGYGIAPYPIDEEFPTIAVDLAAKTVDGDSYAQFISSNR